MSQKTFKRKNELWDSTIVVRMCIRHCARFNNLCNFHSTSDVEWKLHKLHTWLDRNQWNTTYKEQTVFRMPKAWRFKFNTPFNALTAPKSDKRHAPIRYVRFAARALYKGRDIILCAPYNTSLSLVNASWISQNASSRTPYIEY